MVWQTKPTQVTKGTCTPKRKIFTWKHFCCVLWVCSSFVNVCVFLNCSVLTIPGHHTGVTNLHMMFPSSPQDKKAVILFKKKKNISSQLWPHTTSTTHTELIPAQQVTTTTYVSTETEAGVAAGQIMQWQDRTSSVTSSIIHKQLQTSVHTQKPGRLTQAKQQVSSRVQVWVLTQSIESSAEQAVELRGCNTTMCVCVGQRVFFLSDTWSAQTSTCSLLVCVISIMSGTTEKFWPFSKTWGSWELSFCLACSTKHKHISKSSYILFLKTFLFVLFCFHIFVLQQNSTCFSTAA